ncbi:MAG: hypothetical protein OXH06_11720 [Gemmatimonadetes bacterium]|nr:hypothetical protein [Gemmatimonadota bacterium]
MLLTVIFTVALVYTRVAADADQATLLESLAAISRRPVMYILSGVARLLSGIALLGAGLLLLRTWIIRGGWATSAVPCLFVLSGALTTVSGGITVLIAFHPALETVSGAGASPAPDMSVLESMSGLRWLTGAAGFSAAGVALAVASVYQWKVGGTLRKIAPISAVLGVAMQLIWIDAGTNLHSVIGTAFLIWLIVIGSMLASGRVERQYSTTYLNEN